MYSCMVPCYRSSCSLSRAMFLSFKCIYWFMNVHSKSENVAGASLCTSKQFVQHAALPPIKATLYWHTCTVSLPIYGIQTATRYHLKVDSHALTYIVAPVNGFGSASFTDIATQIASSSYSGLWDGPGAFFCYVAGVVGISRCIIAASCI